MIGNPLEFEIRLSRLLFVLRSIDTRETIRVSLIDDASDAKVNYLISLIVENDE